MTGVRTVVAGIGNEYRRDDGAGVEVARQVASRAPGTVDVGPLGEPLDLLGRWDGAELAVVVDTVRSGAPAGTVRTVEMGGGPGPEGATGAGLTGPDATTGAGLAAPGTGSPTSTHGIGLVGVLRLARAVGSAPRRLVLVGIEGDDFGSGSGLSPAVARAVPEAVGAVLAVIAGDGSCA